jgi:hypothetical protein
VDVSLAQAAQAIALADKAIALATPKRGVNSSSALADLAYCMFFRAGLLEWRARRWPRDAEPPDTAAVYREVIDIWRQAGPPPNDVDDLARVHLKTMYLLRRLERNRDRLDMERHGDEVLELQAIGADAETRSWLTLYQAIVHADRGNVEAAQKMAYKQSVADEQDLRAHQGHHHRGDDPPPFSNAGKAVLMQLDAIRGLYGPQWSLVPPIVMGDLGKRECVAVDWLDR